ncbi:MAG: 50S ribosomal protein L11 methyltransferase [Fretibacterium sp.]|nr:50S ribosomal protein L11 methyltransferase [Fretibacterium sp.]
MEPFEGAAANYWWTVDFGLTPGENRSWDEERLLTLGAISGAIGSEFLEEDGKLVLRADYLGSQDIDALLERLKTLLPSFEGITVLRKQKTENQSWSTQHLESFPPVNVGRSLTVMAPWHKNKAEDGRIPIYIYPSSAFGTGYHESTRIALELLEDAVRQGDTILDVGTGTGILFIAALKLGASHAVARDLDPTTLDEVRRNMNLNAISANVCDIDVGNLLNGVEIQANVLTANILLTPNLTMLPDVKRVLKPKGCAVFSGMTEMERGVFLSALSTSGLTVERELRAGDWWGCRARRAHA